MDKEPKLYEIAYLVAPRITEEDVFGEAGKITGFIQEAHGLLGYIEEPKKIRLAYNIHKFPEAYFGWTRFRISPEKIAGIEKKIKLEKNIIRYLLVEAEEGVLPPRSILKKPPRPLPRAKVFTPQAPTPTAEQKLDIEELDKRLEEILGK